jgi:hypothetical protein
MKNILIVALILIGFNVKAQERIKYEIPYLAISFDTKYKLVQDVIEDDPTWIAFENEDFAVDVMFDDFENESIEFVEDAKYGANEIANDMEFPSIKDGGPVKAFSRGYYIIAEEEVADEHFPVIIAALYDDAKKVAYEIMINCYNGDLEEGVRILNTFKKM